MRGVENRSAAGRAGGSRPAEPVTAEDLIAEAVERHHPRLVMACSFQKEESVLIDMLMAIEPSARVFTIDTGALFPDTHEVWRKVEDRYDLHIEVFDASSMNGPWTPENCCSTRKVAALEQALEGVDAWITGIRREQSPTRADAPKQEWDAARGIWKFNPLADWTDHDVWRYVHAHDLPYHPLHDRGYESIGCAPCTLPGAGREGRWAGQEKTECGLHV
ncbi:MAG TPA: phosphoadenylyl-sulfate reductase [Thermoleophilaceae bacterium]|nr:phosphoadenylyl-sulfate reductase [Thermoleophilaceae bacterium]